MFYELRARRWIRYEDHRREVYTYLNSISTADGNGSWRFKNLKAAKETMVMLILKYGDVV